MRRALGYRLERAGKLLDQFLEHLEARGEQQISTRLALEWATLPAGGGAWHSQRLSAVRGFARYLHALDASVEVPAADLLPDRTHRATPYLYTDDQIATLIAAAKSLSTPHRAATYRTLFGCWRSPGCASAKRSRWIAATWTACWSCAAPSSESHASCRCTPPRCRR